MSTVEKHDQDVERKHISRTAGVCGGRACVVGTRIRVQDIYVWHELRGKSPDEIVSVHSHLTLADVYAALSYFWDHRDEILRDIELDESIVAEAKFIHRRHNGLPPSHRETEDAQRDF